MLPSAGESPRRQALSSRAANNARFRAQGGRGCFAKSGITFGFFLGGICAIIINYKKTREKLFFKGWMHRWSMGVCAGFVGSQGMPCGMSWLKQCVQRVRMPLVAHMLRPRSSRCTSKETNNKIIVKNTRTFGMFAAARHAMNSLRWVRPRKSTVVRRMIRTSNSTVVAF